VDKSVQNVTSLVWVQQLLDQAIPARLASADPRTMQPHVVPVWFEWDGERIWISSFCSTRKIREIKRNPRISIVVDVDGGPLGTCAVTMEGQAELITDPAVVVPRSTTIYARYLGEDGVKDPEPASWIVDPENLLICLAPEKIFTFQD
jgi:general stress protein 26